MSTTTETPTPEAQPQTQGKNPLLVIIGLLLMVITALLIFIAVLLTQSSAPTTAAQSGTSAAPAADATQSAAETPSDVPTTYAPSLVDEEALSVIRAEVRRDPNDYHAKGDVDAPVVMVLYSDFACPYCTLFAQQVEPALDDLVENGTLRVEWRDLAQITESSPLAAQAGIAAGKQGKFWAFHDAVYAAADPQDHPEYTQESLVAFAQAAEVPDIEQFVADMNSAEAADAVAQSKQHAYSLGITGTPLVIINDAVIGGYAEPSYVRETVVQQSKFARTPAN